MQKNIYDRIISFLQGASWAIALVGALVTFKETLVLGLALSIFLTIFFIISALFLILALDAFSVHRQQLEEAKKQTQLLEKLFSLQSK